MTRTFIDTHVHLYPAYSQEALITAVHARILSHTPDASTGILMLTERRSEHAFDSLLENGLPGMAAHPEPDGITLWVKPENGIPIALISGKQMATAEKMEVLALGTEAALPDGLSVMESVAAAHEAGAFPVIPWAPGKWLFSRKSYIHQALETGDVPLALADSAMRFRGYPTPPAFLKAQERHIPILAGTDPLPHAGEENHIGRYGILADLDEHRPTMPQLMSIFTDRSFDTQGVRRNLLEALTAQIRHMK